MRLFKVLKNPYCVFPALAKRGCFRWLPDKIYLQMLFRGTMGKWPDLEEPKTYNEKLQWLKLYDRNPEYTMMVDKYAVKEFVASRIGSQYLIPTFGVWDCVDEIDFNILPSQFVLKCTHDCGGLVICKDKATLDITETKRLLRAYLRRDYYHWCREWPYKSVKPKIIAEQYMEDSTYNELRDYKFFCFDGEVKALLVATERFRDNEDVKVDFFDAEYNHLNLRQSHPCADVPPEKPVCFEQMKMLACKLTQGIPAVRADFYEVDGQVFFGELTFFNAGGITPFVPESWDSVFGEWLQLPPKTE